MKSMPARINRTGLCLLIGLSLSPNAFTYELKSPPYLWAEGILNFHIDFSFRDGKPLIEGNPDFDAAFREAMASWEETGLVEINAVNDGTADPCSVPDNEGTAPDNAVVFADALCGVSFGKKTLSTTVTIFNSGRAIQSSTVFNAAAEAPWSVYEGEYITDSNLTDEIIDFRRIAVHEIGHALGLDHPNDAGTAVDNFTRCSSSPGGQVDAIMCSLVSDIERPLADDWNGLSALYDQDYDNVGIKDDNCPLIANAAQADGDGDGVGDLCDPDIDGDGLLNAFSAIDQGQPATELKAVGQPFGDTVPGIPPRSLGQVITAGLSGVLKQIRLPLSCAKGTDPDVIVSVLGVKNDDLNDSGIIPDSENLLAVETVSGASLTEQTGMDGFDAITFSDPPAFSAGDQFAVTLSSPGSCAVLRGPDGDSYPGGDGAGLGVVGDNTWISFRAFGSSGSGPLDFVFKTVMESATSADNCPLSANPDQLDTDSDGIGDACDDDSGDAIGTGGRLISDFSGRFLRNPVLEPGTEVIGGALGGRLIGDRDSPPLINTEISGDAELVNVIIGAGASFGNAITLGPGTQFEFNDLIPAEMDLTGSFPTVAPVIEQVNQPPIIDLDHVLVLDDGSMLEKLRAATPALTSGSGLGQNSQGYLELSTPKAIYTLAPIQVRQASPGFTPGIYSDDRGDVVIITLTGQEVISHPAVADLNALEAAYADEGLELTFADNGNLIISSADSAGESVVIRPAVSSTPAVPGLSAGLHSVAHPLLDNVEQTLFVYEKGGELWQQILLSSPHDWDSILFLKYFRNGVSLDALFLDLNGVIEIHSRGGAVYRAVMDYDIVAGDPSGELVYLPSEDLNGDGIRDFTIIYPDGVRQDLYVVPPR